MSTCFFAVSRNFFKGVSPAEPRATRLKLTEYLQNVRVMKARQLLETTNGSVESIAWAVGYRDPAAFRKVFGRLTGARPNVYRGDARL
ncbi:hypothetical protein AJ87_14055 [Rhizobium yanglingense]|nr:hypothetical protein AJ87_14055 [Rhizobium yanglingense]